MGPAYTMSGSGGGRALLSPKAGTSPFYQQMRTKATVWDGPMTKCIGIDSQMCRNDMAPLSSSTDSKVRADMPVVGENKSKTEGYPLLNAIKGFFSNLLRPIITATYTQELRYANSIDSMKYIGTEDLDQNAIIEPENITFFDCDDYVDNEDTVDFIARSLPMGTETRFDSPKSISSLGYSPQDHQFYDSASDFAAPIDMGPNGEFPIEDDTGQKIRPEKISITSRISADESGASHYRPKKRKRNRKNRNKAQHRSPRSFYSSKNRHEKLCQEIERDIHDDILEYMNDHSPDSSTNDNISMDVSDRTAANATAIREDTSSFNGMVPCSGSLFTCFIPLDTAKRAKKMRTPPSLTPRRLHRWTSSAQTLHHCTDLSNENAYETDEQFTSTHGDLLFGALQYPDNLRSFRSRQLSECSDDFICFEYEDDDTANTSLTTTGDEYTDSDETSEDGDERPVCMDLLPEPHQPDSGFEEKKVNKRSIDNDVSVLSSDYRQIFLSTVVFPHSVRRFITIRDNMTVLAHDFVVKVLLFM